MDVGEQVEEARTETGAPESSPPMDGAPAGPEPAAPVETSLEGEPAPADQAPLSRPILRLAYAIEFWVALIAVYTVWSQVGGQPHLDLMTWWIKLACGVGMSLCIVKMTSAMVESTHAWNFAAVLWLATIVALSTAMFFITYWYHLHEQDELDSDENPVTTVRDWGAPHLGLGDQGLRVVMTRDRKDG